MLVALEPAFGSVDFDILAPDVDVAVDRVARHAENGAFNEVLAHHCQAAFWSHARKANRRCRVDTEPFVDASIEIRQTSGLNSASDQHVFCSKMLIEFLLKFLLDVRIAGKVMYDSGNGTKIA
jgi:hypothetical protein